MLPILLATRENPPDAASRYLANEQLQRMARIADAGSELADVLDQWLSSGRNSTPQAYAAGLRDLRAALHKVAALRS
jgi:hypothetical protein